MTNSTTLKPDTDSIAGKISVHLDVASGRVIAVEIIDTRPKHVARVFVGRKPQDVASMIGSMFSLCSRAQTIAGLEAMEQALGLNVTVEQTAARDVLRVAEMIAQTALRLCIDWPRLLGVEMRVELVRTLLAAELALEKALFRGDEWKVPGGVEMAPDTKAVGLIVQDIASTVNKVVGKLGGQLHQALSEQSLGGFGAVENVDHYEDGALKRQWNNPAVEEMRRLYGVGLATRLEARLVDIAPLAGEINLPQIFPLPSPRLWERRGKKSAFALPTSHGEARVETARGALHHRVTIENNLIIDYQITAPTDANFLARGPVSTGLMGAAATDNLARAAELHVLAIDPCVEVEVRVDHA